AFGLFQRFADKIMRLAEGQSFPNQVVRGFSRQQRRIFRLGAQLVVSKTGRLDSANRDSEHIRDLIMSGKERLFVFFQIALIAGRQALKSCEQTDESTGDPAGLPANELP